MFLSPSACATDGQNESDVNNNLQSRNVIVSSKSNNSKSRKDKAVKVTIKGRDPKHNRKVTKPRKGDSNKLEVIINNKKRKVIPPLYEDKNLSSVVEYFNNHLKFINNIKTSRFTNGHCSSTQKKNRDEDKIQEKL